MTEEIFDVVNERDEVVGCAPRREVHARGLLHRAVHVLVFNARGQVFLQKRSLSKDTSPGLWDSSASGHLDRGEEYDACAMRELREEIGLVVARPPERWFRIAACAETGQEFVWVYAWAAKGRSRYTPTKSSGGLVSPEEVTRWVAEKPRELASAFRLIWQHVVNANAAGTAKN